MGSWFTVISNETGYNRDLTRMAIYNDVLYWTEDSGTSLFSVSLRNNQEETIVLHDIIPLSSIVIWNPKLTECDGLVCDVRRCIPSEVICDEVLDCQDGADEEKSRCDQTTITDCGEGLFECDSGHCILELLVCNGQSDCADASDEGHQCGKIRVGLFSEPHERCRREGLFLCANNQQCLNTSRLCDGKSDCWDGSDEQGKCGENEAKTECSSNKCQQICEVSPEGAKCRCLPGYLTLQNRTCIDIDECKAAEPPICSHICQNFPGSYNCSCHHGYKLTDNGKCSINALGPNKVLYFSDVVHKKIYSSHLDGDWKAQGQEVINVGLQNPEGMDVDWSTGHLYIADSGQGKILACQENGDVCTAVITHLGHPKALSIDQRNR
uniref:Prolow-density lipoprotein receptor-related protein 1 n=1 Tax=Magallana gigas TaxID=29159 RepID=K1QMY2_MAGGI